MLYWPTASALLISLESVLAFLLCYRAPAHIVLSRIVSRCGVAGVIVARKLLPGRADYEMASEKRAGLMAIIGA